MPTGDLVNQPRMMAAGGYGTAWAQRFNVPNSFSKQARFRTSWTGGIPGWGGVISFELAGQTVLSPGADEVGQAWSLWGPTVTGTTDVVWSTTCWGGCMSASDLFEWRTWETGAARFQTRLRFPGQYADAETDFYENWNRYYDPPTGRYLPPEPILSVPGGVWSYMQSGLPLSAYGYALGNPVRWFDPTGLGPDDTPISAQDFSKCKAQAHRQFTRCESRPPVCSGGPPPDCQQELKQDYELCYAEKYPDKSRRPPVSVPPTRKDDGPKIFKFDFNPAPPPPGPQGPRKTPLKPNVAPPVPVAPPR